MSSTTTKIGEPARHGIWGLTVDKMSQPKQFIVARYPNENRRHTEPFEEVTRIPYASNPDSAIASLVEHAGVPKGSASALVFRLSMKLASHKAPDADIGVRPVV